MPRIIIHRELGSINFNHTVSVAARRHSAQRQSENIAQDSFNRRIRTIDRPSALTIARSRPTLIVWSTFPNIW